MNLLDFIILGIILVTSLIVGLIMRNKNDGYRLSETRREQQRRALLLNTKYPCEYNHYCPHIDVKCPFLPNAQHQEQETTRIKHRLDQE